MFRGLGSGKRDQGSGYLGARLTAGADSKRYGIISISRTLDSSPDHMKGVSQDCKPPCKAKRGVFTCNLRPQAIIRVESDHYQWSV